MRKRLFHRRHVLAGLAAGPAAFALALGRAAEVQRTSGLRYILGSSMYGTTRLAEILPEVRKTGAELIDLWPRPHGDQRDQVEAMGHARLAKLLEEQHVGLGMTTRYDLGPLRLADELQFLKRFGGTLVVTGSKGPPDLSGPECKAAVKQFVREMKPHVALAEKLGITIAIENHARALISTLDSLRYFAELSGSRRLGIALAPYHLPQDTKVLARLIADLGPKLVHFYAWEHGQGCMQKLPKDQELQQMPGRGRLDFRPLLAALKQIGYQGWTEIFMHPVPRGIPILSSTAEVSAEINRARQYLEKCAQEL
jgi:sugar phosphate isomerase/epimerase